MSYQTISLNFQDFLALVTLDRPHVRNAFNDLMLTELLDAFRAIRKMEDVRVVILTGAGDILCAGADLNWMRKVKDYTYEENLKDSLVLAECLYTIFSCPKPTIARVNGAAIGGGAGLVAVCDIAIASNEAVFGFSEVKIGVIPACISPYVVRKIGEGACRELFLTGERFSAEKALQVGLVNQLAPAGELDHAVRQKAEQILSSGPRALAACKDLLEKVPAMDLAQAKTFTAEIIASLRGTQEAQEGMAAYLEKRKTPWTGPR
jgi:methylglutaconyl-CoA hydratase